MTHGEEGGSIQIQDTRRSRKTGRRKILTVKPLPDPLAGVKPSVQGKTVGSLDEYRVAQALTLLGMKFRYQVNVDYGRQRRGGSVMDFVVDTPGQKTDLEVNGRYWHSGTKTDMLSMQQASRENNYTLLVIWTEQTTTVADAETFLKAHLAGV